MKLKRRMKFLPKEASYDEMDSPVGTLTMIASAKGLCAVLWDNDHCDEIVKSLTHSENEPLILQTKNQLNEYFQGKRKTFHLPLVIDGTDFQNQVWGELRKIPYGKTISYGEQALRLGDKNKARAVGLANGRNPISIIVPCHRVVGSDGRLVGFAGGVDRKAMLLRLEEEFA